MSPDPKPAVKAVRLLVNPAAGAGRAARLFTRAARRLEALGFRVDTRFSEAPGHLTELVARLAAEDDALLVVCGGDGSLNEALNGLPDPGRPLGLIPCGSGDDIARNLGIPRQVEAACSLIASGTTRLLDSVSAGSRRYLGVGGAGLDAEVNRRANASRLRVLPRAVYAWGILAALRSWRPIALRITADGWRYEGRVMFAVVANAPAYGGGMRISPESVMDDGTLEVCVVEEMGRLELVSHFPGVFGGRHLGHPRFRTMPAARVRIESPGGGDFYADGEPLARLPVEIAVEPRGACLFAPQPLARACLPLLAAPSAVAPA